ncbi:mlp1 [Hyphodiscus hymeniophilus]|uniref:Mlp1 n=1 Tax=Hyphodiscus hymeniophilus TaxID=353542 RepID=A0A9P6VIH9_9HELO|nr:mlp1 [Hyphodiscus hymeniophilus]
MATAVIDVDYLSGYLRIPKQTLDTVIDAPTAELVQAVLKAVTAQAREHDELSADKLRIEIELENAVRTSESRVEGLRSQVEKAQKTVEEVRTKLKEEENSRSSLESEFQTLKSSSTTSTSEVETLRMRISSLEAANRETLAVLESKTTSNDNLAQDLQKQHQKGLELALQITSLKQSVQNAESAASSARFREQSLKQEVELFKKNNEWFENELKTKTAESLKFRKEKGARVAELQRLNEEANSDIGALKRTEQALRNRLDEIQKKAEESLFKVQRLEESAAQTGEDYRQELESVKRLAQLQSEQTETHRNRLQEVEAAFEKAKDDAVEEIGRWRQEAESERLERDQCDHRIAELEAEIDRLQVLVTQQRAGSVPGTPRNGFNGSMNGRAESPAQFGTPGSARTKPVTVTQAMEEVYKLKGLLATEKRRSERFEKEVDEMMQGLEAKQPEIEELLAEQDRLQQAVVDMSTFVDQVGMDRDRAKKDVRKAQSEASTSQAEAMILRRQLRDLSAQIKMLLFDLESRDQGLAALGTAERAQFERLARGEVNDEDLEGMTDTDRFISQRLTIFRNVKELQERNEELLKITRQLGAQMESEEALAAKHQAAKDHEEVHSLQAKIEDYKDELKSMVTRSESYIKERDMFRRMLQHRGQLPPTSDLASMFGQSVDGNQNGVVPTIEQRDNANYATLLRELQGHFDQYREEQTTDRRTMKEQLEKMSLEKGLLQAEIAKTSSQLTLATERYEMLHSNYSMLQKENTELQKRSQILSEAAAKQDLRTQQVAEDLIEAKGLVENMRNENSNLKAEKKLWKDIQDRLSQDNQRLTNEQSRLNTLISNQQTLQNERELSDSETRRRLQAQVESLESELSTTKRKLNDEVEDNKNAQLRKEFDSQQNQKRVDELAASLGQVREELVAAKTTRDHLQSRVDELNIELKSAEERVELLQPRPTPRQATAGGESTNEDDAISREQELAIEVSELKRDLDLSKSELENAKNQMEQYKSISQSSEEELQSLNATQDQYREEMDRIIEEKDSKVREFQQRIDDISAELTTTNNELTTLRNQQSEIARQSEDKKAILEAEIARLKDEDERHATAAQFHQQDLRAQAAIATKAQQDYENELVKHAEAAKLLQNLRAEHNELKSASASLRAQAESAQVALSQSGTSWEERRQQFEQELNELKTRRDDVNAQNKLLHQQLDNVGAQVLALQQSRSSLIGSEAGSPAIESTNDRTADGLRELNTFLRREKEIVEVQYELKVQEAKRLKQQLDYTQSQLDESRLKLDQERRLHSDLGRSSTMHKDTMEQLQELHLHREASVTLRNEARQAQIQLAEKTNRVEELMEKIQPLETKIRELEHGKETADGEMRLLQEDRDRWQKRTQDIISKYDRIDPAEMELLKETIESLRAEKDSLMEEQQPLKEKCETLEAEKVAWQQSRTKIVEQAKERNKTQTNTIRDRTTERDNVIQEKETLLQRLSTLEQDLETAIQEKNAAEQKLASIARELETARSDRDQALSAAPQPIEEIQATVTPSASSQPNEALDQQIAELRKQLDEVTREKQSLGEQLASLREQLEKANSERDTAVAEASEARKQTAQVSDSVMHDSNEEGQIDETPKATMSEVERKSLEDRIGAAEENAKEAQRKAAEIEESQEAVLKQRSDKMKSSLNKILQDSKQSQKAQIQTELEDQYRLKLMQEKQIWLAENQPAVPSAADSTQQQPAEIATSQPPATSDIPIVKAEEPASPDFSNLSDAQIREIVSSDPTIKKILGSLSDNHMRDLLATNSLLRNLFTVNLKKKVDAATQTLKEEITKHEAEAQKLKEEHEKAFADAQQKAEGSQTQAVHMMEKKSSLQLNLAQNQSRAAKAKLEVVEKAANETPEKPVGEVWAIAKDAKAPAAPPAPVAAPPTRPNGTTAPKPAEQVKSEAPSTEVTQAQVQTQPSPQPPSIHAPNGTAGPASNIPSAPQASSNNNRQSGIPTRGGAANRGQRGGGGGVYQVRGGGGRGRGSPGGRGTGINPGASTFVPANALKRPREEGSMGGPQGPGKRARGGGQEG